MVSRDLLIEEEKNERLSIVCVKRDMIQEPLHEFRF